MSEIARCLFRNVWYFSYCCI